MCFRCGARKVKVKSDWLWPEHCASKGLTQAPGGALYCQVEHHVQ